jgi:MFS-type transporter involved in bile tolerance (Atg22 family)
VKCFQLNGILLGSLILAAMGYATGILVTLPAIFASGILIPIGTGLAYMTLRTMYSNIVDKNSQGWAMGIAASMSSAGWGIGSILTGLMTSVSYNFVYAVAFFIVLTGFSYHLIRRN